MSDVCPISGKPVAKRNPELYGVLSHSGEQVRFCCPSHKTRYLSENPKSREVMFVRGNPIVQPSANIRAWVDVEEKEDVSANSRSFATLYIWDDSVAAPDEKLVASMVAYLSNRSDQWTVLNAVAVKGYGPLLYDVMSTYLDEDLHPSSARSKSALAFWQKQKGNKISPLTQEQFFQKYGRPINSLLSDREPSRRAKEIFDETASHVVAVSHEAEEHGVKVGLPYETRSPSTSHRGVALVQLEDMLVCLLQWVDGEDPITAVSEMLHNKIAERSELQRQRGVGLSSSVISSLEKVVDQLKRAKTENINGSRFSVLCRPRALSFLRDVRQESDVYVVTSLQEDVALSLLRNCRLADEVSGVIHPGSLLNTKGKKIVSYSTNSVPAVAKMMGEMKELASSFDTKIVPRHNVINHHPIFTT